VAHVPTHMQKLNMASCKLYASGLVMSAGTMRESCAVTHSGYLLMKQ
jgi:hypothetical protein